MEEEERQTWRRASALLEPLTSAYLIVVVQTEGAGFYGARREVVAEFTGSHGRTRTWNSSGDEISQVAGGVTDDTCS